MISCCPVPPPRFPQQSSPVEGTKPRVIINVETTVLGGVNEPCRPSMQSRSRSLPIHCPHYNEKPCSEHHSRNNCSPQSAARKGKCRRSVSLHSTVGNTHKEDTEARFDVRVDLDVNVREGSEYLFVAFVDHVSEDWMMQQLRGEPNQCVAAAGQTRGDVPQ